VLVLTTAHQQVDPADRRALYGDDDVAGAEQGGIGRGLRFDAEVMLDGVERIFAELVDDDASPGRWVAHGREGTKSI
jgi:hypothetical protein